MKGTLRLGRWIGGLAVICLIGGAVAACGGDAADDGSEGGLLNRFDGGSAPASADGDRDGYSYDEGGAAPPAATTGGEATGGDAASQQLLDRKQILIATVQVETEDVAQKFQEASNIAASVGGVVFSSSFGNNGDEQTASVTLRVPNERYQETLAALRGLGTVTNEQSSGTDVTGEYTDLESRLRNLRATEAQYLTLLTQATNINDILTVQDRINVTRADIEQVQGRMELLDNQTELSTITVHLFPPVAGATNDGGGISNPVEAAERAFEASLAVLAGLATGAVLVLAFSWWIVPLALVAWIAWRKLRAARPTVAPVPPPVV